MVALHQRTLMCRANFLFSFFFFVGESKNSNFFHNKIKFSPKIVFLKNFKALNVPKKQTQNVLFFIKYSWQALLLCNIKSFNCTKYLCLTSLCLLSFKTTKYVQKKIKREKRKKKSNRPTLCILNTCCTTKNIFLQHRCGNCKQVEVVVRVCYNSPVSRFAFGAPPASC